LQQIRGINPNEDISFLKEFSQKNCLFFQEQIKFDLGYFNHGSSLLDKAIASIRGRVAIDQAQRDRITEDKQQERDRNLQIFILAVGSGIGVSGIAASSYTLIADKEPCLSDPLQLAGKLPASTVNPFTLSMCYSLLFGIASGFFILGVNQFCQFLVWSGKKLIQWQNRKSIDRNPQS
jgi:hypothetical protein